jgi:heat shock protein HslJ
MKIEKILKTVLILFPILFSGCASDAAQSTNPLCNVWHLPKAPTVLRISFTPDGRMVGVMGLNNFFAPVQYLPKGRIEIHSIAISRRGEYPDFADRFFKVLRSAKYAGVAGNKLYLFDENKKKVMVMEQFKQ